MIIEFIGIPGSGKSHICNALYKYLKESLSDTVNIYNLDDIRQMLRDKYCSKNKRRFKFLSYILLHWVADLRAMPLILPVLLRKSGISEKLLQIDSFFRTVFYYEFIREIDRSKKETNVYLLDEGYFHRIVSLYVTKGDTPSDNLIMKYSRRSRKSDAVVFINTGVYECFKRLRKRGWTQRLLKFCETDKERYDFLRNCRLIIQKIKPAIAIRKIDIDNNELNKSHDCEFNVIKMIIYSSMMTNEAINNEEKLLYEHRD